VGADRVRFLHGQVTNDIKRLRAGEGCYAALVTAKGKMQSDLNIYCLQDELLLDFEPGLTGVVSERLEKFVVADDVQILDVAALYGLLSVQGPKAESVARGVGLFTEIPGAPFRFVKFTDETLGEIYLMNQPRLGSVGFDFFVPTNSLGAVADKLIAAAKTIGGRASGWDAFEISRIESGIPRFGADMDESHLAAECGIENRAISYNKGCYIGQEVLNRIHSIGRVNRELRRLRLPNTLIHLPEKGDKLFRDGKEVGHVTSATKSPIQNEISTIGYVRREAFEPGTVLVLQMQSGSCDATILEPFSGPIGNL
jgi:folate-binding protein YgfZ